MLNDKIGLAALEAQIQRDLQCLSYPDKSWVPETKTSNGESILDCAVVGGGQFGLAISFGLRREKVENVRVFDSNPEGFEGPWMTFARMSMLRTPKDLTGPDLGIGGLTFRSWYEAQHGAEGWKKLVRIPRDAWMNYLRWYRAALKIDLQNDATLRRIDKLDGNLFRLTFAVPGGEQSVVARTVVLSTGAEGSGARYVPSLISDNIPAHLYAHTNDAIDLKTLKGKRVAVLGAGASAFDYASASLEAGAKEAHIFFRRAQLPLQNPRRWMEFSGFLAHYPELPDDQRWAYMKRLYDISQPPPVPTFERATSMPGFSMHPGSAWTKVSTDTNGVIHITTAKNQTFDVDFVIAATGMVVDLGLRPELASLTPHVRLWGDHYEAPQSMADDRLERFPYLGRYCDFQEKVPGTAPWINRIFTITRGSTMSMGPSAASNSNLKYTAPRIVAGVCRQLFLDQASSFYDTFVNQEHNELSPERVKALA